MIVSPAGPTEAESVQEGVALLESWGLRAKLSEHALETYGYLSAPDNERLADLNAAIADPEVRAVMATRGGYGVQRIIDDVDFEALSADPKLVIGYSDITALHLAVQNRAGMASLHAPMAAWSSYNTKKTERALRNALTTTEPVVLERRPNDLTGGVEVPGKATGTLVGGNLTLLTTEPESGNLPDFDGAILFIEDVGESPYSLDRMLTMLIRTGRLEGLAGVAIGQFTGAEGDPGEWTLPEVLVDRLTPLGVPVLGGLPIGHDKNPRVMPLGVRAELDTSAGTLTVESAVA